MKKNLKDMAQNLVLVLAGISFVELGKNTSSISSITLGFIVALIGFILFIWDLLVS